MAVNSGDNTVDDEISELSISAPLGQQQKRQLTDAESQVSNKRYWTKDRRKKVTITAIEFSRIVGMVIVLIVLEGYEKSNLQEVWDTRLPIYSMTQILGPLFSSIAKDSIKRRLELLTGKQKMEKAREVRETKRLDLKEASEIKKTGTRGG